MKVPIYIVVKGTGQFDPDGAEYVLTLDAKLTRAAAEASANAYGDAKVVKMVADKYAPDVNTS